MTVIVINPQAAGLTESDKAQVLGIALFWRSNTDNGYSLKLDAEEDLKPWIENAALRGQAFLDISKRDGNTLQQTLQYTVEKLQGFAKDAQGKDGTMADSQLADETLVALLILRSFGLANDEDDYNGLSLLCANDIYEPPTLTWNEN